MFTGIITAQGTVLEADSGRFAISCPWEASGIAHGASIACDGCCLTVTGVESFGGGSIFRIDVSNETLSKTTLGGWARGRRINLERSLRFGDEMGGHLVSGHVDGVARIESITPEGFSKIFAIRAPEELAKFIAPKGSVALDGVSLTINDVSGSLFTINLIPTTLEVTVFGEKQPGDAINMEVDLIARYVGRLLGQQAENS
ncbi:riboflavin synthase [Rhodomicrobium lacus]|jgi:riboflavin synthase|uniref:riboflavin synthase n=1 Tax=Rhodomicrobium TaxID=1068 RepID=UPI000F8E4CBB|nr:riboflavin synthase [Rhodomicrobium lacus]WKW51820.1 riboflavin synthase [Rhodomicrobium lacus]